MADRSGKSQVEIVCEALRARLGVPAQVPGAEVGGVADDTLQRKRTSSPSPTGAASPRGASGPPAADLSAESAPLPHRLERAAENLAAEQGLSIGEARDQVVRLANR